MKSHKLLTTAGIGALMFGMTSAAMADNWRYAHEEYEGDVQDVFAVAFKEYVEENSDHSVQIYRFGELGESDDIMEQTQNGILQFVNQSPGFTGALIPSAQIFFIPYLLPTDMEGHQRDVPGALRRAGPGAAQDVPRGRDGDHHRRAHRIRG